MRQLAPQIVSIALCTCAQAATWTVDDDGADFPGADFADIQSAIDAASGGDTVLVYPGTYTDNIGPIVNTNGKAIVLRSTSPHQAVIDGQGAMQCIVCNAGESSETKILDFTITMGSDVNGAGLYCGNAAGPTVSGCMFAANFADAVGGAIYCIGGSAPIILDCSFEDNHANWGGAIGCEWNSDPTVQDCTFSDNIANAYGGAVYTGFGSSPMFKVCTLEENSSYLFGGSFACIGGGNPTIEDCVISGSVSQYGAVYIGDDCAPLLLQGSIMDCYASKAGGAVYIENDAGAEIREVVIQNNTATGAGGGVLCTQSQAFLYYCVLMGNSTSGTGGGISIHDSADVDLLACELSLNSAANGGGIYLSSSDIVVQGCEVNDNAAASSGGALYGDWNSAIYFSICTMSGNTGNEVPGVSVTEGTTLTFDGANTSDSIHSDGWDSTLTLDAGATCEVTGDVEPSDVDALVIDLDDLNPAPALVLDGTLTRQGCFSINNSSDSLSVAAEGMVIPLIDAGQFSGAFGSIILPIMPEGLGLQVTEGASVRGGASMQAEVVAVTGATFSDPVTGSVDAVPVDIVSLDVNGDGADELAVLFPGTDSSPGVVGVYSVSADAAPALIDSLTTTTGDTPVDMDAGDLDGDGRDDLVVADQDNMLAVLASTTDPVGNDVFSVSYVSVPASDQVLTCVAIADMDQNRWPDAVVGVDYTTGTSLDALQVVDDVGAFPASGSLLIIPGTSEDWLSGPDAPTVVHGGPLGEGWGIVCGTANGRVIRGWPYEPDLEIAADNGGHAITDLIAGDLDADGGDGHIDVLAASADAASLYILPGSASSLGDAVPCTVDEPVESMVTLDADGDGDMDIVIASPDSTDHPLLLMRNDGEVSGGILPPGGNAWSRQAMPVASAPRKIASGGLNNKDDDDDWVVGGGEGSGLLGDSGVIEQTNVLEPVVPGDQCSTAVTADLGGNAFDTSALSDSGFGDPDESQCPGTYLAWNDSQDAWFVWTAPSDGTASFSTCDATSYDTSMVLYAGTSCEGLVQIACNGDGDTDGSCQSYYSLIEGISVAEDDMLYVRVGGWNGVTGPGTVTIDLVTSCPEDIDGNGTVNIDDLLLVLGNFNGSGEGDVDGSGTVNIDDMLLVIAAWGSNC